MTLAFENDVEWELRDAEVVNHVRSNGNRDMSPFYHPRELLDESIDALGDTMEEIENQLSLHGRADPAWHGSASRALKMYRRARQRLTEEKQRQNTASKAELRNKALSDNSWRVFALHLLHALETDSEVDYSLDPRGNDAQN